MARGSSTRRDYRTGGLGVTSRLKAVGGGIADGSFAVPLRPAEQGGATGTPGTPGATGTSGPGRNGNAHALVRTGHIDQAHSRAQAISNRLGESLLRDDTDLIKRIHDRAAAVVREHDVDGNLTEATEGRFVALLGQWRVDVAATRYRAAAAVEHANLCIDHYWTWLERRHRELRPDRPARWWRRAARRPAHRAAEHDDYPPAYRPPSRGPEHVRLDPAWHQPDRLLLVLGPTGDGQATTNPARVLSRALEIVGDSRADGPTPVSRRASRSRWEPAGNTPGKQEPRRGADDIR